MKNLNFGQNLALFLILAHLGHISYLFHIGTPITLPVSLILAVLVILYGGLLYLEHVKKPDAHKILEENWKEYKEQLVKEFAGLSEEFKVKKEQLIKDFDGLSEELKVKNDETHVIMDKRIAVFENKVTAMSLNQVNKTSFSNEAKKAFNSSWGGKK